MVNSFIHLVFTIKLLTQMAMLTNNKIKGMCGDCGDKVHSPIHEHHKLNEFW